MLRQTIAAFADRSAPLQKSRSPFRSQSLRTPIAPIEGGAQRRQDRYAIIYNRIEQFLKELRLLRSAFAGACTNGTGDLSSLLGRI